jgi:hypothetical protein
MRHRGIVRRNTVVRSLSLTAALTLAGIGIVCWNAASAEPLPKPLDLTRFMHQPIGKSTERAAKKPPAIRRTVAKRQERPATAPPSEPAPLPVEAARADAVQPGPPVRVVASDQLNEIDIVGDAVPVAGGTAAPNTENAVKLVEASEFNEIDRKADDLRPAAVEIAPPHGENLARSDHASNSWVQQAWAKLQGAFAVLAAAIRQSFG